jgi:transcription initiation factor TFIID subunit 2
MVSAVACATVSIAPPERGELLREEVRSEHTTEDANLMKQAVDEVSRYRSMDRLIPSPKNVVTTAVLEVSSFLYQRTSPINDFDLSST